jgi:L-amino acid N-acyltransferase YncA
MATSANGESYPKDLRLSDGRSGRLRFMQESDKEVMLAFARDLPQDDLLFLRTDITDPATIDQWIANIDKGTTVTLLAEISDELAGYASLHLAEARWTRRVGEIRIQVAPHYRGIGLGRRMAGEIFNLARSHGIKKVTAMMTPDQAGARTMFEKLGFQVEALLTDWVEDRNGHPRDLLVMSHDLAGFTDRVHA